MLIVPELMSLSVLANEALDAERVTAECFEESVEKE